MPLSFPHELEVFDRTTAEQVADRIADADIVITNKAPVREAALEGAKRLRLVAVAATGTDMVDVKAANARGDHRLATSATTPSTPCPSTPSR